MSDAEKLIETFRSIGYSFVVLVKDKWTTVVLCDSMEVDTLKNADSDYIYDHAVFEFDEEGKWASYP